MHDRTTMMSSARVPHDRTGIFPALYPLIKVAKNKRLLSIYLQFNYYASLRYTMTLTTSACANYLGKQLYFEVSK